MTYNPELVFTDKMAQGLSDLSHFLIYSAMLQTPPLNELKERLMATMDLAREPGSCFFGVIDLAYERLQADDLFPEDVEEIVNDLYDDLNNAQPAIRVKHSDSDDWSEIERLTGDGRISVIAKFASPSMAEDMVEFIAARADTL